MATLTDNNIAYGLGSHAVNEARKVVTAAYNAWCDAMRELDIEHVELLGQLAAEHVKRLHEHNGAHYHHSGGWRGAFGNVCDSNDRFQAAILRLPVAPEKRNELRSTFYAYCEATTELFKAERGSERS